MPRHPHRAADGDCDGGGLFRRRRARAACEAGRRGGPYWALAGANSIFTGDKLLTAPNAGDDADGALFAKLGLVPLVGAEPMRSSDCARIAI